MNIRRACDDAGVSHSAYYVRRNRGMTHDEALADAILSRKGEYKHCRQTSVRRRAEHLQQPTISQLLRDWRRPAACGEADQRALIEDESP